MVGVNPWLQKRGEHSRSCHGAVNLLQEAVAVCDLIDAVVSILPGVDVDTLLPALKTHENVFFFKPQITQTKRTIQQDQLDSTCIIVPIQQYKCMHAYSPILDFCIILYNC